MADYTIKVVISSDAKDLIGALQKSGVQIDKFEKGAEAATKTSRNWGKELLKLGAAVGIGMGLNELVRGLVSVGKESLELSRSQAAARGALIATVGSVDQYNIAINEARLATNGMVSEQELASSVNIMLATGLADSYTEAGRLSQQGSVLTQVFSAAGATQEKFTRLLQSGNLVLYDNFGLTQDMVNGRKALIEASGEAQGEEAKLLAIRQLLQESADKYSGTLDEAVIASAQYKAAVTDLKAALGDALMPTVTDVTTELAKQARILADMPEIMETQRQHIFDASDTWKEYLQAMRGSGLAVKITKSEFEGLKTETGDLTHENWRLKEAQEAVRVSLDDTTEAADRQVTTFRYVRDEEGKWTKETITLTQDQIEAYRNLRDETESLTTEMGGDAWDLAREQSKADDWAQYHRYEYYEALGEYYQSDLDEQQKALDEEQRLADERQEMLDDQLDKVNDLNSALADYYLGISDAQSDSIESEADYHASIGELQSTASEKQEEAEKALSEKLEEIEKQRQDKIAWVRTGAWNRTAEEESEAEAYHNQIYDEMRDKAIEKTKEKVDGVLAEEAKKEAAMAAAHEKEIAEQAAALEEMKLNAALALIEQAGLLSQFTGGMATSAADAAAMIKAGIIPVTEEMGLVLQNVMGDMASGQEAAAANAQANADVLSEALAGTINEDVIPSIEELRAQQQEMSTGFVDRAYNEMIPALDEEGLGGAFTILTEEKIPGMRTAHEELMSSMVTAMNEFLNPAIETVDLSFDNIAITTLPTVQSSHTTMANSMTSDLSTISGAATTTSSTIETKFKQASDSIDKNLIKSLKHVYEWLKKIEGKANKAIAAINEMNRLGGPQGGGGGEPGGQHGLDMVVPPGFPNDSYRIWATSGERVQVTPPGQSTHNERNTSTINNFYQTVNTQADSSTVIHDFNIMRTLLG